MKRSSQVALLLMGVTTAGASSYAFIPPRDCAASGQPAAIGAVNPQTLAPGAAGAANPAAAPCNSNSRSSWYGSNRSSYWSSRSTSSSTTQASAKRSLFSPSTSHTSVPSVGRSSSSSSSSSRGGFGSTGHSVGSHSSGS
jgi:hypothetical protein